MNWPSISLNLNLIKKQDIYAHYLQFATVHGLKQETKQGWFSTKPHILQTLVHSMPNRIFKKIQERLQNLNSSAQNSKFPYNFQTA